MLSIDGYIAGVRLITDNVVIWPRIKTFILGVIYGSNFIFDTTIVISEENVIEW